MIGMYHHMFAFVYTMDLYDRFRENVDEIGCRDVNDKFKFIYLFFWNLEYIHKTQICSLFNIDLIYMIK